MFVTGIFAGLAGLLLFKLSLAVIKIRRSISMPAGDGGEIGLAAAIRAQSNFIEYTPLFLLMLGLLESQVHAFDFANPVLGLLGAIFLFGRVLHANSLSREAHTIASGGKPSYKQRRWGMYLTFWPILIVATALTVISGFELLEQISFALKTII